MIKPIETSKAYEDYLRTVVAPICEATVADPSRVLSTDEVEAACEQWDREDKLNADGLKRSA